MPLPTSTYHGVVQPRGFPGLPEGWVSDWETFQSTDGVNLIFAVTHHSAHWTQEHHGHRALVVLHGFGEHGGRYLHFPHFLKDTVGTIHCPDFLGHGRSEGLRGDIERFDRFAEDAAMMIRRLDETLRNKFGKSEIHVLGHSMGGHVALRMLFLNADLPIRSVSVSAPFLAVKAKVPMAKKIAARLLSSTWGTIQIDSGLDASELSRDPEVVANYRADRLNHSKMTPRFYTSMIRTWADTLSRDTGIQHPLLFQIPMADRVVDAKKSIDFFNALKHRDKRLKAYTDLYHEPFNEIGKEEVFGDLSDWIRSHQ